MLEACINTFTIVVLCGVSTMCVVETLCGITRCLEVGDSNVWSAYVDGFHDATGGGLVDTTVLNHTFDPLLYQIGLNPYAGDLTATQRTGDVFVALSLHMILPFGETNAVKAVLASRHERIAHRLARLVTNRTLERFERVDTMFGARPLTVRLIVRRNTIAAEAAASPSRVDVGQHDRRLRRRSWMTPRYTTKKIRPIFRTGSHASEFRHVYDSPRVFSTFFMMSFFT